MGLYGREPDLSSDIKERFAQLCEEHGILRENIIDPSGSGPPGLSLSILGDQDLAKAVASHLYQNSVLAL